MSVRPCPECHGARLRPESLAVKVGGLGIHELTAMSARRAIEWFDALELTDTERQIARLILREIDERLRFLDNVGRRLPVAGARRLHAVGRRGAADPAGHADRLEPGGRAVHPRRAVDRPPPARQRAADLHPRAPARPRQHGDRGGARRGHHARGRPPGGPRPGGRRARRPAGGRGPAGGRDGGAGVAHRPVPGGHRGDRGPAPAPAAGRVPGDRGRVAAQPARREREGAAGRVLLRHGRVGLGQVDAGQRGAAQGGGQPPAPRQAAPRRPPADHAASTRSTRSSTSTSRRSGARRGPTRPPTSGCSTRSATSSRAPRRRARAATSRAGSRST